MRDYRDIFIKFNKIIDPKTVDFSKLPAGVYQLADKTSYFHCPMDHIEASSSTENDKAEARIAELEVALRLTSRWHHDTCAAMLSPDAGYDCSCGKAQADEALKA